MMWHGMGVNWYGAFIGFSMMVLFWGGIIAALIWVGKSIFQSERKGGRNSEERSEALAVLDRRYASGEIDQETYKEMKRDLKS